MKENIYIKSLKLGFEKDSGISFNELVKELNIHFENDDQKSNFIIWFYSNFYNEKGERFITAHFVAPSSSYKIQDKLNDFISINDKKAFIKGDALNKYIDYLELERTRKSSRRASWFSLIAILLTAIGIIVPQYCNNKIPDQINNNTESTINTETNNGQVKQTDTLKNEPKSKKTKITDCRHPEYFEFKHYKEYCVTDTINIDLNGNGILEKIYFENKNCPKLIIEEKGQDLISIGCRTEKYKGFPNAIGWVNLWCVVSDKETYEIIVDDGELVGDKIISLERPSIYVGKEEAGGGIITYKNGKLYWIHQSD